MDRRGTRWRLVRLAMACVVAPVLVLCGCDRKSADAAAAGAKGGEAAAAVTNRVDIGPAVRQNLGITFAKVESRKVSRTLRVPGRFELMPTARREYRAVAAGRVELLVEQYAVVAAGTPLYRLDSPRWREMQKELADAEAAVRLARAGVDSIAPLLAAHENHHVEIQKAVDLWTARVAALEQLQAAGGVRGDEVAQARAAMATARSDLAETMEKEAELEARRTETAARLDAASARLAFLYEAAASLVGVSAEQLRGPTSGAVGAVETPRWRTISAIEVVAMSPGVVEVVDAVSGGVVEEHGRVVTVVQPGMVRFRAAALQSDLPRLAEGQRASVVAAQLAGVSGAAEAFTGTLTLAPTADAERRTVDLVLLPAAGAAPPEWAKAGVSAFLEVVTVGGGESELAVPLKCVARGGGGTAAIIFRRDRADANKAIRIEADLGVDDGRWVVIRSGVAEGDEIVLDGVYQLMVATTGGITKGGHFHPDGTFHEDDH